MAPAVTNPGNGSELAVFAADLTTVLVMHRKWCQLGPPLEALVQTEFGFTFIASDPDGHHLRMMQLR